MTHFDCLYLRKAGGALAPRFWGAVTINSKTEPGATTLHGEEAWDGMRGPEGLPLVRSLRALGSTRVPNDTASGTWGPR